MLTLYMFDTTELPKYTCNLPVSWDRRPPPAPVAVFHYENLLFLWAVGSLVSLIRPTKYDHLTNDDLDPLLFVIATMRGSLRASVSFVVAKEWQLVNRRSGRAL